MYPLVLHFKTLLQELQPSPERLDLARDLPSQVREFLKQHEDFETKSPHSRLVGSYAQHLSVGDIKDVDFLVFVDGDPTDDDPQPRDVLRDLVTVLDDLPEYLGYSGSSNFDFTRNRRSVTVTFDDEDFHLDVVPCIAPNGTDEPIWVPDLGFETWIESHPLGVVALIKELEEEHPGRMRNLAKLLKHFRNEQMTYMRPKSYWLVALVIEAIRDGEIDTEESLAVCFDRLLNHLYNKFAATYGRPGATPNIKDPMLGHNVSWNWARSDFEAFMRRLDEGRKWTGRAIATNDKEKAIELWRRVFGDKFPETVEDEARSLSESLRPGMSRVAASGLVLPTGTATRSTPVPSTRFYGSPKK